MHICTFVDSSTDLTTALLILTCETSGINGTSAPAHLVLFGDRGFKHPCVMHAGLHSPPR